MKYHSYGWTTLITQVYTAGPKHHVVKKTMDQKNETHIHSLICVFLFLIFITVNNAIEWHWKSLHVLEIETNLKMLRLPPKVDPEEQKKIARYGCIQSVCVFAVTCAVIRAREWWYSIIYKGLLLTLLHKHFWVKACILSYDF